MAVTISRIKNHSGLNANQANYSIDIDGWKCAALVERLKYNHDHMIMNLSSITLWGGGVNFIAKTEVYHNETWLISNALWNHIEDYGKKVLSQLFTAN